MPNVVMPNYQEPDATPSYDTALDSRQKKLGVALLILAPVGLLINIFFSIASNLIGTLIDMRLMNYLFVFLDVMGAILFTVILTVIATTGIAQSKRSPNSFTLLISLGDLSLMMHYLIAASHLLITPALTFINSSFFVTSMFFGMVNIASMLFMLATAVLYIIAGLAEKQAQRSHMPLIVAGAFAAVALFLNFFYSTILTIACNIVDARIASLTISALLATVLVAVLIMRALQTLKKRQ